MGKKLFPILFLVNLNLVPREAVLVQGFLSVHVFLLVTKKIISATFDDGFGGVTTAPKQNFTCFVNIPSAIQAVGRFL